MYATCNLIEGFFYSQRGQIVREHNKNIQLFSESKKKLNEMK